jgi:agmatine deiminase
VRPGAVILQGCSDPDDPDFERMAANRETIEAATDAAGRRFEIYELPDLPSEPFDGTQIGVAYANIVLVDGAVILGTGDYPEDEQAVDVLGRALPGHEIVEVPGALLSYAGGGPHCTTMQIPAGGGR